MTNKPTHGGARPHPPGREGGRPKMKFGKQVIVIDATPEEKRRIEQALSTRERTEKLLADIP
jgi:hypothetical protein